MIWRIIDNLGGRTFLVNNNFMDNSHIKHIKIQNSHKTHKII